MTLRLSLLSPLLLLAACASQPAVDQPAATAPAMACNADAAKALIGQLANEANVEAVRKTSGATSVRALKPSDAMTMDYRGDRVNVLTDAAGNIEKISCG